MGGEKVRFGSLFTGIGGFDLGFERAGMECAWQCEINPHAISVLEKNFPAVRRYADIRESHPEPVDLLCGGFPCQDVSIAGRRKGLAGERSGLWAEYSRVIDELEPVWVVIENVPGLLSSNGGRDFAHILQWLVKRGYGVCWRIFDSQYFGLAQRRKRVFIVGSFGNGNSAKVLFEREGLRRNSHKVKEAGTVAPTILGSGSGTCRVGSSGSESEFCIPVIANTLTSHHARNSDETLISWVMRGGKEGGGKGFLGSTGRSLTLKGKPPYVGVRRLMPVECERLQGFPDGWTNGQTDTQRYIQLGNAVSVPVAEWIGKRVMEVNG